MLYNTLRPIFGAISFVLGSFVGIAVHEIGHLLVAVLIGARGHHIHFGTLDRPEWGNYKIWAIWLHVHDDFFVGGLYHADEINRATPLKGALLFLGGPLLSLLAFVVVWVPNVSVDWELIVNPLRLWFLWSFVVPLIPFRIRGKYPSDGLGLLANLRACLVKSGS